MGLYTKSRDISLFRHLNRELLNDIIEQKVGYYVISLEKTKSNIYGESNGQKFYNDPVLINCLIERGEQQSSTDEFGPDIIRNIKVRFLRDDLAGLDPALEQPADARGFNYNISPKKGDILVWNENYYEVDNVIENQLIGGKDPSYSYAEHMNDFGSSWSIIVETHYIRPEIVGLKQERL